MISVCFQHAYSLTLTIAQKYGTNDNGSEKNQKTKTIQVKKKKDTLHASQAIPRKLWLSRQRL